MNNLRVLILKSDDHIKDENTVEKPLSEFAIRMDTRYAKRVIKNIENIGVSCGACGKLCVGCRSDYKYNLSRYIAGVVHFPSVLPAILDDPEEYLHENIPQHDVVLALSVNEEILISFLKNAHNTGGIIVPVEDQKWLTPYGKKTLEKIAMGRNIEISFPKPFCSFNPDKVRQPLLYKFKMIFKIGLPDVGFIVENNKIVKVIVKTSAPCGCTYYTAKQLRNLKLTDDLVQVIDNAISAYPCTASRMIDPEFGDSITHRAVKIQRNILKELPKFEKAIIR